MRPLCIALSFILMASPVLAQDVEITLFQIPEGTRDELNNKISYTFEEWLRILDVDQKLKFTLDIIDDYKRQAELLAEGNGDAEALIQVWKMEATKYKEETTRLRKLYLDTDKKWRMAEAGSIMPSLVLIGGAVLAIVGGIALIVD